MARNTVMKLWTTLVTAFLALCTALGLITTTASVAVPQTESACNSTPAAARPAAPSRIAPPGRSLPPTMKQRIRAEAHGSSPSCRIRPASDATTSRTTDSVTDTDTAAADVTDSTEVLSPAPVPIPRE